MGDPESIYVDHASFGASPRLYVGRTFRGLFTRFYQHAYLPWGPQHVQDARRAFLYDFLATVPQDSVAMIPILPLPSFLEFPRTVVADCLERRCIFLLRSHQTMGGLNTKLPTLPSILSTPLPHFNNMFSPLQFIFSRLQLQDDGPPPAPHPHPHGRDYFRRIAFLLHYVSQGVSLTDLDNHLLRSEDCFSHCMPHCMKHDGTRPRHFIWFSNV